MKSNHFMGCGLIHTFKINSQGQYDKEPLEKNYSSELSTYVAMLLVPDPKKRRSASDILMLIKGVEEKIIREEAEKLQREAEQKDREKNRKHEEEERKKMEQKKEEEDNRRCPMCYARFGTETPQQEYEDHVQLHLLEEEEEEEEEEE